MPRRPEFGGQVERDSVDVAIGERGCIDVASLFWRSPYLRIQLRLALVAIREFDTRSRRHRRKTPAAESCAVGPRRTAELAF